MIDQSQDLPAEQDEAPRCGYAAIVGRPNVGKSTLLNHVLGQKLSITSRKPQTTQHQILGIKTEGAVQILYVDTPGMHQEEGRALSRHMNRAATSALATVDVVVMVVDRLAWSEDDQRVLDRLADVRCPVVLAINKVDRLADKSALMPYLEAMSQRREFAAMVPISALNDRNLDVLEREIARHLPENEHFYPEDQITDRSQRFLAAELVREKIMRQLGAELPYAAAVEIEEFRQEGRLLNIGALILVERDGQKRIIIGEGGDRLRKIGQEARLEMERMFESKVMLKLWVKVKRGWADNERALKSLGFGDR